MPEFLLRYVRIVDGTNRFIGRLVMWGIFGMIGILLYASSLKACNYMIPMIFADPGDLIGVNGPCNPPHWILEGSQFSMSAYYLLGGAYSLQLASHVRMDLLYGGWSDRTKTWVDSFTVLFLIVYLAVLLYGGFNSVDYAIEYSERSRTLWRPYMWPIKVVMVIGILLMLLQAISEFLKDVAKLRGVAVS